MVKTIQEKKWPEGLYRNKNVFSLSENMVGPWKGFEFGKPVNLFTATTFKGLEPDQIKERKIVGNADIGQVLVELVDGTKILMKPKNPLFFPDGGEEDLTPFIKVLQGTLFLEYHASNWLDVWGEMPEVDTSEGIGDIFGHIVLSFPVQGFLDELTGNICLENQGGNVRSSVTEFVNTGLFRQRKMIDESLSEPTLKQSEFVSVKKYFEGAKIVAYRPNLIQEGYVE